MVGGGVHQAARAEAEQRAKAAEQHRGATQLLLATDNSLTARAQTAEQRAEQVSATPCWLIGGGGNIPNRFLGGGWRVGVSQAGRVSCGGRRLPDVFGKDGRVVLRTVVYTAAVLYVGSACELS